MYVKIRIRAWLHSEGFIEPTKNTINMDIDIPKDTRKDKDAINDAVSDFLDENGIIYDWYELYNYTEGK